DVHVLDRGDPLDVLDGVDVFDLDGDEVLGVGPAGVLGEGQGAVAAVHAGAVHAAEAARVELGPVHDVLRLPGVAYLGRHDPAGARFEGTHDRGVVGGRQADEGVQAARAGGAGAVLDLLHGQTGVLLVKPDRVEAAEEADHLDHLGIA